MKVSSSFPQFNRKELDFGTDLDRDGVNEKADAQGDIDVVRAGIGHGAGRHIQGCGEGGSAHMQMQIHLSGAQERLPSGTDVMTAWFAKGVGLVKYVERQELSPMEDRGVVTDIMEELESYRDQASEGLTRAARILVGGSAR